MTKAIRTYTGDAADYGVEIIADHGETARVRIMEHDSPACTIPVGTIVTVSTERVI